MSENTTYRVIRQLDHYTDEETSAMAYQNLGPFENRQHAEAQRAGMLEEQAKFAMKVGAYSEEARIDAAARAASYLNALAAGFHDETINANGINWTIREIPGTPAQTSGCRGCAGTCCTGEGSEPCTCE